MSSTHWQLTTPNEHTYDPASSTLPAFGEVDDEPVTGTVTFHVDDFSEAGDYYILYKPEPLDAARGIWQLSVA